MAWSRCHTKYSKNVKHTFFVSVLSEKRFFSSRFCQKSQRLLACFKENAYFCTNNNKNKNGMYIDSLTGTS